MATSASRCPLTIRITPSLVGLHPSNRDPALVTLRTFKDFVAIIKRAYPSAHWCEELVPALYDAVAQFMMEQGGNPFVMMCSKCRRVAEPTVPTEFWEDPSKIFLYVYDDGSREARPLSLMELVLAPYSGTVDFSGRQGSGPLQCHFCCIPMNLHNTIADILRESAFARECVRDLVRDVGVPLGLSALVPERAEWRRSTICGQCRKPNPSKRCRPCGSVRYCDEECQKQHWRVHHKKVCSFMTTHLKPHLLSGGV